jgi:ribosomal protein S18 acetylase RimI-like enzyme
VSFAVHADTWLSEIMGRPAFRVDGSGDAGAVASHRRTGFYFAKVATDHIADVHALSLLGFTVVDTNVTFELQREPELLAGGPDIGELRDDEAEAVLEIAGSAFRYSRFHLDPQIEGELAHRIKREWIRNYTLRKRGDALLVARAGGKPVGFLAALRTNPHAPATPSAGKLADAQTSGTAVIDLVAVATDANGRGIGSALTAAFAHRYRAMPRIVGTQVANVPSIRLYTKLGFALARSQYVLHLHVP